MFWRPALEPHGVDEDVEGNRPRQRRCRDPTEGQPLTAPGKTGEDDAEPSASSADTCRTEWAVGAYVADRVDIAVEPQLMDAAALEAPAAMAMTMASTAD